MNLCNHRECVKWGTKGVMESGVCIYRRKLREFLYHRMYQNVDSFYIYINPLGPSTHKCIQRPDTQHQSQEKLFRLNISKWDWLEKEHTIFLLCMMHLLGIYNWIHSFIIIAKIEIVIIFFFVNCIYGWTMFWPIENLFRRTTHLLVYDLELYIRILFCK